MQVLTMVTLSFTLAGALAGLMGMNLYFATASTPLVSNHALQLRCREAWAVQSSWQTFCLLAAAAEVQGFFGTLIN